jgi:hypothetical protein
VRCELDASSSGGCIRLASSSLSRIYCVSQFDAMATFDAKLYHHWPTNLTIHVQKNAWQTKPRINYYKMVYNTKTLPASNIYSAMWVCLHVINPSPVRKASLVGIISLCHCHIVYRILVFGTKVSGSCQ